MEQLTELQAKALRLLLDNEGSLYTDDRRITREIYQVLIDLEKMDYVFGIGGGAVGILPLGDMALAEYEASPAPDDVATLKARIAELEANLANALEVSRIKGEELAAAIAENEAYRRVLKPFAESVGDADVKASKDDACLGVEMGGHKSDVFVYIETGKLLNAHLRVRHLRDAAEIYAKFEGAGDE